MKKFAILGIQRTGTTLIRTTLDSHPDILCMGELFNAASGLWPSKPNHRLKELKNRADLDYRNFATMSLANRLGHIFRRESLVTEFLDRLYSQQDYSAIGFKFMLNHLHGFPVVEKYIAEKDISVIHIVRTNVFDTYLSKLTMVARGIAHSTSGEVKKVQVDVPIDSMLGDLEKIRDDGEKWASMFSGKVPYIRVEYESFVDNRQAELARILGFLDVSQDEKLESSLKKINKGNLGDLITNYAEVKHRLEGTEFEWCLAGRD